MDGKRNGEDATARDGKQVGRGTKVSRPTRFQTQRGAADEGYTLSPV